MTDEYPNVPPDYPLNAVKILFMLPGEDEAECLHRFEKNHPGFCMRQQDLLKFLPMDEAMLARLRTAPIVNIETARKLRTTKRKDNE